MKGVHCMTHLESKRWYKFNYYWNFLLCLLYSEQMNMQRVGQSWHVRSDHQKLILSRLKRTCFMPEDPTQGKYLLKVFLHVLGRKPTFFKCPVKVRHPTRYFFIWEVYGFDHVGWLFCVEWAQIWGTGYMKKAKCGEDLRRGWERGGGCQWGKQGNICNTFNNKDKLKEKGNWEKRLVAGDSLSW